MSNSFFRFNIFSTIGENPVESLWRRIRRFSKKKRPQKGPILQKLPQIGEIPDKTEKNGFPAIYSRPHDQRSLGTLRKRWKPVFAPPKGNPVSKRGGGTFGETLWRNPLEKPVENTKSPSLGRPRKGTAQRGVFSSTITGTERQFGGSPPGWPRRTAPPWWSGSRSADRR